LEIPNIYNYDNYRKFLTDLYKRSKAKDKKFSFRYFARIARFQSFSYLRNVMVGKKNLSEDATAKLCLALKLNREETFYFSHLVFLNQAKTVQERQYHAEQLLTSRTYKKLHPLSESQFKYYSQWYFVPVRELVGIPGFREDPEWIAKKVSPPITSAEAKRAIEELLKLDLLQRSESGHLIQTSSNVSTGNEVSSAFVARWHQEMMKKASESIDRHTREKREISASTFKLSAEAIQKFKEVAKKFHEEVMEIASKDLGLKAVYQLNLQLFPLSEKVEKEKT
jgi:uncharacterized protein (TIGR02147 family)